MNTIVYEKNGAVAHIVLNRPSVVNAYNMQMRDELYQVLEAVRDDPDVRAAVLSGGGHKGFCAGADLTEFGTAPSQAIARKVRWERDVWGLFLGIPKPFVAALHGFVIGSGVEMAMLCDVRIAAEDAVFGMPEVALGMIPAAGGTQTLPRSVWPGRTVEMLLTSRRLNAQEALAWGLVHLVTPRKRLMSVAQETAVRLASREVLALAYAKEAVVRGMDMPLHEGLEMERRLAVQAFEAYRPRSDQEL